MSKKVMRLLNDADETVITSLENLLEAHTEGGSIALEFGEFAAALHGGGAAAYEDGSDLGAEDDVFVDDAPVRGSRRSSRQEPDDADPDNTFADDEYTGVEDDLGAGDYDPDADPDDMGADPGDFEETPRRQTRRAAPAPVRQTRKAPAPVRQTRKAAPAPVRQTRKAAPAKQTRKAAPAPVRRARR